MEMLFSNVFVQFRGVVGIFARKKKERKNTFLRKVIDWDIGVIHKD